MSPFHSVRRAVLATAAALARPALAQPAWPAGHPIESVAWPWPWPRRSGMRRLPEPVHTALEGELAAIFADPAWAEAAARAGLILQPLVRSAYRQAALGGKAALRALSERRPWED